MAAASMTGGIGAEHAPPAEPVQPAELSEPTHSSNLRLMLGGQTGSENAQGLDPCSPLYSEYALSDVTPLGFAASDLAASTVAHDYWLSGLGLEGGPAEIQLELAKSARFIDRDPDAAPDHVCIDALLVNAAFVISSQVPPLRVELALYADDPAHFGGEVTLDAAGLPEVLVRAAGGAAVIVAVENVGDGVRIWFYRKLDENELIGRLVPLP